MLRVLGGSLISCRSLTQRTTTHTSIPARVIAVTPAAVGATAELHVYDVIAQHDQSRIPSLRAGIVVGRSSVEIDDDNITLSLRSEVQEHRITEILRRHHWIVGLLGDTPLPPCSLRIPAHAER